MLPTEWEVKKVFVKLKCNKSSADNGEIYSFFSKTKDIEATNPTNIIYIFNKIFYSDIYKESKCLSKGLL